MVVGQNLGTIRYPRFLATKSDGTLALSLTHIGVISAGYRLSHRRSPWRLEAVIPSSKPGGVQSIFYWLNHVKSLHVCVCCCKKMNAMEKAGVIIHL